MKLFTHRIVALVLLICCLAQSLYLSAQEEVDITFNTRMNYVFGVLEKNRVPNGMLLDYAMEFTDIKAFNGSVLVDSNYTDYATLGDIYNTLITSRIHTNATGLISPNVWDSLWNTQRQDGRITLSGVFFNYARFKDNAVSGGFMTISSEKFVDRYVSGVWQNPYITDKVFAITPSTDYYEGKNLQVVLPSNLWLTNGGATVSTISIDVSDGLGYRAITLGQSLPIAYSDTGRKEWKFKLTLTTGVTLYSHSSVFIKTDPYNSAGAQSRGISQTLPIFTATQNYLGIAGQGYVTINYANADQVLRRPLIVAEGFDAGHILHPERWFGSQSIADFQNNVLRSTSTSLIDLLFAPNQSYDIVYVDWKVGTDYIQRNALLLEDIIRWVNINKQPLGGVLQDNVIIGQSMGGLITRWALKDMENHSENPHTRLFVSDDSPQLGANVPLGYQYLVRHARSLYVKTGIMPLVETVQLIRNRISPYKALSITNTPAAKQMLINWVNDNNQVDNTFHAQWQTELQSLGYPNQNGIRIVAISNGSECAITQPYVPGALLFDYTGKASTRILSDLILSFTKFGNIALVASSYATGQPAFLMGILPGKNEIKFEFKINAQPLNTSDRLYRGYISFKKMLLWAIPIQVTLTNKNYYANPSTLPYDYYPGGQIITGLDVQSTSVKNWFIKYNVTASHIQTFSFVPVVSALDIGVGAATLFNTDYLTRYIGAAPPASPKNTPFVNFITAYNALANNEDHIDFRLRNGDWLANEISQTPTIANCSVLCGVSTITGNTTICSSEIYQLAGFTPGGGTDVFWSASPLNIVIIVPSADGSKATITRNSSGNVTLKATITACGQTRSVTKNIRVGGYGSNDYPVTGPSTSCKNSYVSFSTVDLPGATNYTWVYPGYWTDISGQGTRNFMIKTNTTSGAVGVRVANACDAGGSPALQFVNVNTFCGSSFAVSPNPASGNVTISTTQNESTTLAKEASSTSTNNTASGFTKIKLFDKLGNLKKEYIYAKGTKQTKLDLSALPPDMYIIKVFDGTNWEEHKIIVSH